MLRLFTSKGWIFFLLLISKERCVLIFVTAAAKEIRFLSLRLCFLRFGSLFEKKGTRAIQMGQIYRLLEEFGVHNKTFLCGDMNHCPTLGENHFPSSSFDLWPLLHPEEDGWTENALINLMLASKPGKVATRRRTNKNKKSFSLIIFFVKHPLVRFDRIVMTGAETDKEARQIRILGTGLQKIVLLLFFFCCCC